MMELEVKLKKWFLKSRAWVQAYKQDPLSIFKRTDSGDCPGETMVEEFLRDKDELSELMKKLVSWLSENGMNKAMEQLPSVGKFLSLLCKLPFVMACDEFSKDIVDCVLSLSDLLANGDATSSRSKRAKTWAVDQFSSMCAFGTLEGLDFDVSLMEEFGVSQNEYITQHTESIVEDISFCLRGNNIVANTGTFAEDANTPYPDLDENRSGEQSNDVVESILDIMPLIKDSPHVAPLWKNLIGYVTEARHCSTNTEHEGERRASSRLFQKIKSLISPVGEDSNLLTNLSVDEFCLLVGTDYEIFERYVVFMMRQCMEDYPLITADSISSGLVKYKIPELLRREPKIYFGIVHTVKTALLQFGNHPALMLLLSVVRSKLRRDDVMKVSRDNDVNDDDVDMLTEDDIIQGGTVTDERWLSKTLQSVRKLYWVERSFDGDEDEEVVIVGENGEEEEHTRAQFTLWFNAVQDFTKFENIIVSLFDKFTTGDRSAFVELLIWFLYPTNFKVVQSSKTAVLVYVKTLRNLVTKKHLQLNDIQYLFDNVTKTLTADVSAILFILHVAFIASYRRVSAFATDMLKMIYEKIENKEEKKTLVFWFIVTVQAFSTRNINKNNNNNNPMTRISLETRRVLVSCLTHLLRTLLEEDLMHREQFLGQFEECFLST